ncbi:MAG: ABC transporter ATP-binding protein [Thermoanaerobacterales bacterium]|nr:ABC transporter ATP-binding protein [Thermoanaerobacterales bacterium]
MLEIKNLTLSYGQRTVLHNLCLDLPEGASLAVIGESGAGKSSLGLAVAGLSRGKPKGRVLWRGEDLLALPPEEMRRRRWTEIALVFQSVGDALHPALRVVDQVAEPLVEHGLAERGRALERARELLREVRLPAAKREAFPHALSGGEKQRAMIAMALACDPRLVIMDEPTASLDAGTKKDILELIRRVCRDRTLIVMTHDLGATARLCERVAVLYGGRILEEGPAEAVLGRPRHPYTRGLLRAFPDMTTTKDLQGVPGTGVLPSAGCVFAPRCTQALESCRASEPRPAADGDGRRLACHRGGIIPVLRVEGLRKRFGDTLAVDGVSLAVEEGETLAVVGESGSGKTTLANLVMGLVSADAGRVYLEDQPVGRRGREFYRAVQMVFQDPMESISHRFDVLQAVREPLDLLNNTPPGERLETVRRALADVHLPTNDEFLAKYPHHLSRGEAQRVTIARALTVRPRLLVADEPTSALDASVQAKIIKLLLDLQEKRGLALVLITHDIAVARKVSDRIAVMQAGRIVECGPTAAVLSDPQHPYTRSLLTSAS